jgi:hypothetical protein
MVSGVSEWPAKAPSPALGLCVPIAPLWRAVARLGYECSTQKKHTETSPLCRRLPACAVSVCVYNAARSGSSRVRAMRRQDNRAEAAAYTRPRLLSTIFL